VCARASEREIGREREREREREKKKKKQKKKKSVRERVCVYARAHQNVRSKAQYIRV